VKQIKLILFKTKLPLVWFLVMKIYVFSRVSVTHSSKMLLSVSY